MRRALAGESRQPESREPRRKRIRREQSLLKPPVGFEIAQIGRAGFDRIAKKKDGTEVFVTSIGEIQRVIDIVKEREGKAAELDIIRAGISKEYHDYADVFSKKESDTLSPSRPGVDHKIELLDDYKPGYCPLYKMS
ncbi:hypothetical protein CBS147355_9710 [Penicillium roqueforti]|nr:hypothetical protein CBS147355_9710 [Penicillium roqueforti]KAI3244238.1 hypothetical protein CBS147309_9706 [Penicillium roqueforti]